MVHSHNQPRTLARKTVSNSVQRKTVDQNYSKSLRKLKPVMLKAPTVVVVNTIIK